MPKSIPRSKPKPISKKLEYMNRKVEIISSESEKIPNIPLYKNNNNNQINTNNNELDLVMIGENRKKKNNKKK